MKAVLAVVAGKVLVVSSSAARLRLGSVVLSAASGLGAGVSLVIVTPSRCGLAAQAFAQLGRLLVMALVADSRRDFGVGDGRPGGSSRHGRGGE